MRELERSRERARRDGVDARRRPSGAREGDLLPRPLAGEPNAGRKRPQRRELVPAAHERPATTYRHPERWCRSARHSCKRLVGIGISTSSVAERLRHVAQTCEGKFNGDRPCSARTRDRRALARWRIPCARMGERKKEARRGRSPPREGCGRRGAGDRPILPPAGEPTRTRSRVYGGDRVGKEGEAALGATKIENRPASRRERVKTAPSRRTRASRSPGSRRGRRRDAVPHAAGGRRRTTSIDVGRFRARRSGPTTVIGDCYFTRATGLRIAQVRFRLGRSCDTLGSRKFAVS